MNEQLDHRTRKCPAALRLSVHFWKLAKDRKKSSNSSALVVGTSAGGRLHEVQEVDLEVRAFTIHRICQKRRSGSKAGSYLSRGTSETQIRGLWNPASRY